MNRIILILIILSNFWHFAEAENTNSSHINTLQLPSGAFWIDNYWRDVRGCAQFEPVHWRNATGCIRVLDDEGLRINEKGLDKLYISGSAEPTLQNMHWLQKTYGAKHPVYIIDLRQETHVYVNGLPISIFYKKDAINWGKTSSEINAVEHIWSQQLLKKGKVLINKLGKPKNGLKVPTEPLTLSVKETYTEETAAKKAGIGYFRIEVPDYHPPTPAQVDQFLQIIKKVPSNAWLHFHCAAGEGRTTTFMVMRDMLANAKEVSFEDIITRQARLGGINLLSSSDSIKAMPWKDEYGKARIDYIHLFYSYIHSDAYKNQTFTNWINKQQISPYKLLLKTKAYAKPLK